LADQKLRTLSGNPADLLGEVKGGYRHVVSIAVGSPIREE